MASIVFLGGLGLKPKTLQVAFQSVESFQNMPPDPLNRRAWLVPNFLHEAAMSDVGLILCDEKDSPT